MMKRIQRTNRTPVLIGLTAITVLLGTLAWFAIGNLSTTGTTIAASQLITPADYQARFGDDPHTLIDVRTPEEFNAGHIPGSININVETLQDRLDEVPEGVPIVVYCRSGNRSASAAKLLVDAGFSPIYDLGGLEDWVNQGYPIE